MKAAVFESKEKVVYRDFEDSVMGDDDVLVKIKYCGICGTDVAFFQGIMPYLNMGLQKYPFVPGHEWSGTVVDIGKNVNSIKIGDRVTGDVSIGCGKCRYCMEGKYNLCTSILDMGISRNKSGGMAEYLTLPEKNTYKFSDSLDFRAAAMAEPLACALYGVDRKNLGYDENILVTGTGLLGLFAAQVAQTNSSATVILSGRTNAKLEIAKACGIKNVVNIRETDMKKYLSNLGILNDISFCIECSGNIEALNQSIEIVKGGGEISIIGFYEEYEGRINIDLVSLKDLEIHGIMADPNRFRPAISLLEKGLITYEPLITKIFNLSEINEAMQFLLDKKNNAIKVMLKVGD